MDLFLCRQMAAAQCQGLTSQIVAYSTSTLLFTVKSLEGLSPSCQIELLKTGCECRGLYRGQADERQDRRLPCEPAGLHQHTDLSAFIHAMW